MNRKGIALVAVLLVVVALSMLSALAFSEAIRDWRVASLAEDAVHARAGAMAALAASRVPPDLPGLCVSGPLVSQEQAVPVASGASATVRWRALGGGVVQVDAEGRGRFGARARFQALFVPDSTELTMGLLRCPDARRLLPVTGRWQDGHPEG
jgi:hypothetical protein